MHPGCQGRALAGVLWTFQQEAGPEEGHTVSVLAWSQGGHFGAHPASVLTTLPGSRHLIWVSMFLVVPG